MALRRTIPPQPPSGENTFSDNLVGFQLVTGGGLTNSNFEFKSRTSEKTNRTFSIGSFSDPISLESLNIDSVAQSRMIFEKNFKVYPNYDLTYVTNFSLYGSLSKRISTSITKIISYFPAGLEAIKYGLDYGINTTATNISYSLVNDETTLTLDIPNLRNPFGIDFTINATRNLQLLEIPVSGLRNLTTGYTKYSLYINGNGYNLTNLNPTDSLTSGNLILSVQGNPFSGAAFSYDTFVIRPNDNEVNQVFNENFDNVEKFLLNRNVAPIYTATFKTPKENELGNYYVQDTKITWPINAIWNLDIQTEAFTSYLTILNDVAESFDLYQTNLISRFLTTPAFKEFDTVGQKMEKILQIYGRSFDEVRKFINALAFMNSVNYNVGDDIPSQLLKNLAQTIGWSTNISPISNESFLTSVFGQTNTDQSMFTGVSTQTTPDELNFQFYRNLILNSSFLFKSKGTRKSIETLLRFIGAPEALVEFNEYVYLADQRINLRQFNTYYTQITGGTYTENIPILEVGNIFTILGSGPYTGFTTTTEYQSVNLTRDEFPMDDFGYPKAPIDSESYYFQIGSGWFEQTPQHRAPEQAISPSQTILIPYTYGQPYLDRFRKFPFMNLGYGLTSQIDNNKSWVNDEVGIRENLDGNFNARYNVEDDRLVLNVKNVDLFMNPAQGILYDVWEMSRTYNFPIPDEGLNYVAPTFCNPNPNSIYPSDGGVDRTIINPQPKVKSFFEFAQTFWQNTINVRNRLYAFDGKTGGYPTLQSIFWKYIQSVELANVPNDNFSYRTLIDYVNGLGDYWIRLIEQMIPATTIWNTGIKLENSIFHRQKFVWRRQRGCEIIPLDITTSAGNPKKRIPSCRPCVISSNIFPIDCVMEATECPLYPWEADVTVTDFTGVLGRVLSTYTTSQGFLLKNCDLSGITSQWYVEIKINNVVVVSQLFFNGTGYFFPGISTPTTTQWYNALLFSLDGLKALGYDYYLTSNNTIVVYNNVCSVSEIGIEVEINIGINFQIYCG